MNKLNELLSKIISKLNASVKTEAQSFSEEEKAQARANIGAISEDNIPITSINGQTGDVVFDIPVIDSTLTVSGQAADAKAVGDEIARLKQQVETGIVVSDDGEGNLLFEAVPPEWKIEDDDDGNITIT